MIQHLYIAINCEHTYCGRCWLLTKENSSGLITSATCALFGNLELGPEDSQGDQLPLRSPWCIQNGKA